jgi:putative hydrolase of the HAD superfamily
MCCHTDPPVNHLARIERSMVHRLPCSAVIEAVLWDFGGVILTSPFEAFAAYEREVGLPAGFIRRLNATNAHDNAWARLERNEVDRDGFAARFEAEAAAAGGRVSGHRVLDLLAGDIRPEMVTALGRCREAGLRTACLTNNFVGGDDVTPERERRIAEVMSLFDVVVESSKIGVRKPEPRFYALACELVGVAPDACAFLDDLGVNLKPAREMGMATIKVDDPETAIAELEALLGIALT